MFDSLLNCVWNWNVNEPGPEVQVPSWTHSGDAGIKDHWSDVLFHSHSELQTTRGIVISTIPTTNLQTKQFIQGTIKTKVVKLISSLFFDKVKLKIYRNNLFVFSIITYCAFEL